ncbi:MAG: AAA family ATPase [Desulfobacterales bacterium]|nr:AAA family ATPase [Desulfobacterales bacterium]
MEFMMSEKRKLPLGVSDFRELIEKRFYYADKTLFIKEVIDSSEKILLLPRPRRFGKTLNLSMLLYFFEKSEEDLRFLFEDFEICKTGAESIGCQGKYPVVFLTFKDIKGANWQNCLEKIKYLVKGEYKRHRCLLEGAALAPDEKEAYNRIIDLRAEQPLLENSLKDLIALLRRRYNERVIVLIDEYDTPVHSGYLEGYYKDVVSFMRGFLGGGLKDNADVEKGVITGILRVARESIFSDLNNLTVSSILDFEFADKFGFTRDEVNRILADYELTRYTDDVARWYDGYYFSNRVVYNPWSILNFVNKPDSGFKPYWVNTSSNEMIKELLIESAVDVKPDLEVLLSGGAIRQAINDNIVLPELSTSDETIWNFLLFMGYLKAEKPELQGVKTYYDLKIPNFEVKSIYDEIIMKWIRSGVTSRKLEEMLKALTNGDIEVFERYFQEYVVTMMSYHDTGGDEPEKVYQAFTLGLLVNLEKDFIVTSNREAGYGRYDIMIIPRDKEKLGLVMELKKIDSFYEETVDIALNKALEQITEREYSRELRSRGVHRIMEMGVVFDGKRVHIRVRTSQDSLEK